MIVRHASCPLMFVVIIVWDVPQFYIVLDAGIR